MYNNYLNHFIVVFAFVIVLAFQPLAARVESFWWPSASWRVLKGDHFAWTFSHRLDKCISFLPCGFACVEPVRRNVQNFSNSPASCRCRVFPPCESCSELWGESFCSKFLCIQGNYKCEVLVCHHCQLPLNLANFVVSVNSFVWPWVQVQLEWSLSEWAWRWVLDWLAWERQLGLAGVFDRWSKLEQYSQTLWRKKPDQQATKDE